MKNILYEEHSVCEATAQSLGRLAQTNSLVVRVYFESLKTGYLYSAFDGEYLYRDKIFGQLMPANPQAPARVLGPADIDTLLTQLRELQADQWTALATYFDVIA